VRYQFVDCRWELGSPGRGRELYLAGHIPGASFLDVDEDLAGPPGEGGRHPLPGAETFGHAASEAGIGLKQLSERGTVALRERSGRVELAVAIP